MGGSRFSFLFLTIFISTFKFGIIHGALPKPIIHDEEILKELKKGIYYIYNCEFNKAMVTYELLKKTRPDHPVTPFFYGLAVYWKDFPLIDGSDDSKLFEKAMEEAIALSEPMWLENQNNIEGVFFQLVSRAMLMMHYSDKGYSSRVLKLAPTAYKQLIKSYELQETFKEFYFITGLYNYYIEAYPEKNPVYKPIRLIFRSGNRSEGIRQLNYAIDSTMFVSVESSIFLSIIYYDFERNTPEALKIMENLALTFPRNTFFASQYIEFLLSNGQYEKSNELIQNLVRNNRKNGFIVMKAIIFKAIIEEKWQQNLVKARSHYELGLKLAQNYDVMANDSKAYAYYGLSRIEKKEGNLKKSREYEKEAHSHSRYGHFTE